MQVGHIFRFHPVTATLRAALAAGRIGAVRYATGRFSGFKRPRTDVGVTHTDAIHYFDLFAYLLGAPRHRVTALQRDFLGRGLDDMSSARWPTARCRSRRGRLLRAGHPRECVIVGERETLVADFGVHRGLPCMRIATSSARPAGRRPRARPHTFKATGPEPLRRELELFLDAARDGGAPPVDVMAGLVALEAVEAAQRSAALGRRVTLAELA